jgi:predicted nucleic acid-binding protein
VRIDDELLEQAAGLEPAELRSLDAIHLATALALGRELGSFVTYDPGLARAARAARLKLLAPG